MTNTYKSEPMELVDEEMDVFDEDTNSRNRRFPSKRHEDCSHRIHPRTSHKSHKKLEMTQAMFKKFNRASRPERFHGRRMRDPNGGAGERWWSCLKASNGASPMMSCMAEPMELESDFFWEESVQDAVNGFMRNREKLNLALDKRDIASQEMAKLRAVAVMASSGKLEGTKQAQCNNMAKRREKRKPSPFIRFYLCVYRELCGKCDIRDIAREAARRWRCLSHEEKMKWGCSCTCWCGSCPQS